MTKERPSTPEERAINLLRGLHKVVLDLSDHFDKPITDENLPRWLALNSAQEAVAKFLSTPQSETGLRGCGCTLDKEGKQVDMCGFHIGQMLDSAEKRVAQSAGERAIAVDVPMIEAACESLLETSGVDLSGDAMREALQAALRKATPVSATERLLDEAGKFFDWGNSAGDALKAMMDAYERRIRSLCTPEQLEQKPWECAEFIEAKRILGGKPNWVIDVPDRRGVP